jgi:hypothetical protein
MNFSNKEYLAVAVALFLVVLLSQTRYMRLLFQTILGRTVLLASVIYFSYVHKMLGVAAALILVIVVSTSGFKLMEGAENMDGTSGTSTDATAATTSDTTATDTSASPTPGETMKTAIETDNNPKPNVSGNLKDCVEVLKANDQTDPDWTRCQREAQILSEVSKEHAAASNMKEIKDAADATKPSDATETNMATEGFDVLGMERSMQLGKRSSSIPVYRRPGSGEDFNILPNDVVTFFGFSLF